MKTLTPGAKRKTAAAKLGAMPAALLKRIECEAGSDAAQAAPAAWMRAVAKACRGELEERLNETMLADRASGAKRVHYLSMEFLMGRALGNALAALGLDDELREAGAPAGVEPLADVLEREADAALGNGGLGRLAACFLDSFATLGLPSFGYGVRYQYGMFAQRDPGRPPGRGARRLAAAAATRGRSQRPELRYAVGFGGRVHGRRRRAGAGCRPRRVVADGLRLHRARPRHASACRRCASGRRSAEQPIDFAAFCRGEHLGAARASASPPTSLNWVLYPDDSTHAGRELRLKQEFLLVSASLQDMLARHLREHGSLARLRPRQRACT